VKRRIRINANVLALIVSFFAVLLVSVAPKAKAIGDYGRFPVNVGINIPPAQNAGKVPVTFGHVFSPGHVPTGSSLTATLNGKKIDLQVDVKARNNDQSLRHAVLTLELDSSSNEQVITLDAGSGTSGSAITKAQLLAANFNGQPFDAVINVNIAGVEYHASARDILNDTNNPNIKQWLQGPLVSEWILSAPVKKADGSAHPHLQARFNVRAYRGLNHVKVDVILENNWSFVAEPDSFTYDLSIIVAGQLVMQRNAQDHWHHARWIETFWLGGEPVVNVKHDAAYLIATHALPNYNLSVSPVKRADRWNDDPADVEMMKIPRFTKVYMPTSGAQPGIGPLPEWAAGYLLSMDPDYKRIMLGMSERAGSWSMHFRDENTDLPISIRDPSNGSIANKHAGAIAQARSGDRKLEVCLDTAVCGVFPKAAFDLAHMPEFSYLPYLVTGDYYHLEELQFWANFAMIWQPPGYREYERGLVQSDQVRAQGWGLRTIANAAYITPDDSPLKSLYTSVLHENALYYQDAYLQPGQKYNNNLGALMSAYSNAHMQNWMDDYFSWSVGYISEMGFSDWASVWSFKSKFAMGRIMDDGFCWSYAAPEYLSVGPDKSSFYASFADIQTGNYLPIPGNYGFDVLCPAPDGNTSLQSDPSSPTGYGAFMQPAMAVAVDNGFVEGSTAAINKATESWQRFSLTTRQIDYARQAQFAVLPRVFANNSNALNLWVWANPNTITLGESSVIQWNASSGASCNGSGNWTRSNMGSSGNASVTPQQTGSFTYTITCQDANANEISRSADVSVFEAGSGPSGGNNPGGSSGNPSQDSGKDAGGSLNFWLLTIILLLAGRQLNR